MYETVFVYVINMLWDFLAIWTLEDENTNIYKKNQRDAAWQYVYL